MDEEARKKFDDLGERIRSLENYWYVTIAVAAILGVGGAFLGTLLADANKQIAQLKTDVSTASSELMTRRSSAIQEIENARAAAVASAASSVQSALATSRQTTVEFWLQEERQARQTRDQVHGKWIKYVYQQANANGDTSRGANGWWQDALKKQQSLVEQELQ